MMQRLSILLFLLTLGLAACDPVADPGDPSNPGTATPGKATMTLLADLPRAGGNVTAIDIAPDNRVFAIIDGKLHTISGPSAEPQIFNADAGHLALGIAPSGEVYTIVDRSLRVYDPAGGTFTSAAIDPAGPFSTNGRIEDAEFAFSPSGEPYVRIISNYPRTYIYRTSDKGATWESVTLPNGFAYAGGLAFAANGDLLMSSTFGFYRSSDRGATWTTSAPPRPGYGGELLVAASGDIYHYANGAGGLKVSRDGGTSFTDLTEFNKAPFFYTVKQGADGALYGLAFRRGSGGMQPGEGPISLLRSTDGGTTWRHLLFAQGTELAIRGSRIAVGLNATLGGKGGGIYLSDNGGTTWTSHGLAGVGAVTDVGFDRSGNMLVMADFGLYRRVGTEWQTLGSQQNIFHRLAASGAMLIVNQSDILYSSDDGATWSESAIPDYTPMFSGSVVVPVVIALPGGGFIFTLHNYSTASGPVNGHIYKVGSDGRAVRIKGVSQTFARIVSMPDGRLYGISDVLNSFSQTYDRETYISSDGGNTWNQVSNAQTVPLAANSRNRFLAMGGTSSFYLQTPGSDEKSELVLDGFTSQTNYLQRALFGPDDRLYMITSDKGLFVSSAPVR